MRQPHAPVVVMVQVLFITLFSPVPSGPLHAAVGDGFTVGLDAHYEPFSFVGCEGYTGFDVDVLDALFEVMDAQYTIKPMPFQELPQALAQGKIDAAMSGVGRGGANADGIERAAPYYHGGLRILVREDSVGLFTLDGLAGKTVGTKLGSNAFFFLYDNVDDVIVSQFPDISDAYNALIGGELDAVFFDAQSVGYFSMTHGKGKAMVVGPLYQSRQYGIAVPLGSEWTSRLNDALTRIQDNGTMDKIYRKWFGTPPQ